LVRDSLKASFEHRPALQQLEDAGTFSTSSLSFSLSRIYMFIFRCCLCCRVAGLLAHGVQSKGVSARLQASAMALSRSMLNDKLAQVGFSSKSFFHSLHLY
jgi:hypothetical protein